MVAKGDLFSVQLPGVWDSSSRAALWGDGSGIEQNITTETRGRAWYLCRLLPREETAGGWGSAWRWIAAEES